MTSPRSISDYRDITHTAVPLRATVDVKHLCVLSRSFPKLLEGGGQTRELLGGGLFPALIRIHFWKLIIWASTFGQEPGKSGHRLDCSYQMGRKERNCACRSCEVSGSNRAQYRQLSISTNSKGSFQLAQNWLLVAHRQKGANRDASFSSIPWQGSSLGWHILTHLKTFLPKAATAHQYALPSLFWMMQHDKGLPKESGPSPNLTDLEMLDSHACASS